VKVGARRACLHLTGVVRPLPFSSHMFAHLRTHSCAWLRSNDDGSTLRHTSGPSRGKKSSSQAASERLSPPTDSRDNHKAKSREKQWLTLLVGAHNLGAN